MQTRAKNTPRCTVDLDIGHIQCSEGVLEVFIHPHHQVRNELDARRRDRFITFTSSFNCNRSPGADDASCCSLFWFCDFWIPGRTWDMQSEAQCLAWILLTFDIGLRLLSYDQKMISFHFALQAARELFCPPTLTLTTRLCKSRLRQ